MKIRGCPYCQEQFTPSHYHPDQVVCSQANCQRRRRAEYHRQKLIKDPAYQAQCHDSQQKWREHHPDYMRTYRTTHKRSSPTKPRKPADGNRLQALLELVKNNAALDLKASAAEIWLISADVRVKNTVADAQIIVIQAIVQDNSAHDV